jgi:hypothetical protein
MINHLKESLQYTFLLKANITLTNYLNHYHLLIIYFLKSASRFRLKIGSVTLLVNVKDFQNCTLIYIVCFLWIKPNVSILHLLSFVELCFNFLQQVSNIMIFALNHV